MMTAVKRCTGPGATEANRLNWASLAGKMDFAHLHGFELWLHSEKVPLESSRLLVHTCPPARRCQFNGTYAQNLAESRVCIARSVSKRTA